MRLLYVTERLTVHDRRFLAALTSAGHAVWLVSVLSDVGDNLPLGVTRLGSLSDAPIGSPEQSRQLRHYLNRVAVDLVHAGPVTSSAFIVAAAPFRPLVATAWAYDLLWIARRDEEARNRVQFALGRTDLLIVDAFVVETEAVRQYGYRGSIARFPWGTDLRLFRPPHRRGQRTGKEVTVVSLRAWEPLSGIETLLDGFTKAWRRDDRLRLLLANGGSLAPLVDDHISRNEMHSVVHRPGVVPEERIAAYLQSADIYVSCSLVDGSSVSLLQALASGLPIVATDIAGNREWLTPHDGCRLIPVGDADSVGDAILQMAGLSQLQRAQTRDRHRLVAEARADWDKNAQLLVEAYERAAGASGVG